MKKFYYYSDVGCIKIGNENFVTLILNGKGEGSFWINICDEKEKISKDNYEFDSVIKGEDIYIFEHDIGNKIITKLKDGIYAIFRKKGDILIERREKL